MKSRELAEDLGVESSTPGTIIQPPPIPSDADGLDNLILSVLSGTELVSRYLEQSSLDIDDQPWSTEFQKLMNILRG